MPLSQNLQFGRTLLGRGKRRALICGIRIEWVKVKGMVKFSKRRIVLTTSTVELRTVRMSHLVPKLAKRFI